MEEEKKTPNGQTPTAPPAPSPAPEEAMDMETLLAQEGLGLGDLPQRGDLRTGVITSILPHSILVDVQAKSDGIIAGNEFEDIAEEDKEAFQVGDEIPVYVLNPEDTNGNVVLSYTRAKEEQDWEKMAELLESKESIETVIEGFNKGGLLVPLGNLRGFVPGSLISVFREKQGPTPEDRWGHLVGEKIELQVMEVKRDRRRLVLSERDAIGETREAIKDKLLEELEVGSTVSGYVSSIANFGAFVNIQGIDGLVHISELSWDHIDHPGKVVKKGQKVDVKIINIDKEERRIGLSLRALQPDPWLDEMQAFSEGGLVQGTITNLTNFGAFARLENTDIEGLIHISELSQRRIGHPKEIVSTGDTLTLRVIKIDNKKHQIGLSLAKVDDPRYASQDLQALQAEIEAEEEGEGEEPSPEVEDSPPEETSPEGEETPAPPEDSAPEGDESPAEERSPTPEDLPAQDEETSPESDQSPAPDEETPPEPEESPPDEAPDKDPDEEDQSEDEEPPEETQEN